jgi:hypothetical protein
MGKYQDDWFDKLMTVALALLLVTGSAFLILFMVWVSTYLIRGILSMGC